MTNEVSANFPPDDYENGEDLVVATLSELVLILLFVFGLILLFGTSELEIAKNKLLNLTIKIEEFKETETESAAKIGELEGLKLILRDSMKRSDVEAKLNLDRANELNKALKDANDKIGDLAKKAALYLADSKDQKKRIIILIDDLEDQKGKNISLSEELKKGDEKGSCLVKLGSKDTPVPLLRVVVRFDGVDVLLTDWHNSTGSDEDEGYRDRTKKIVNYSLVQNAAVTLTLDHEWTVRKVVREVVRRVRNINTAINTKKHFCKFFVEYHTKLSGRNNRERAENITHIHGLLSGLGLKLSSNNSGFPGQIYDIAVGPFEQRLRTYYGKNRYKNFRK